MHNEMHHINHIIAHEPDQYQHTHEDQYQQPTLKKKVLIVFERLLIYCWRRKY